jgi:hypothetical protein
LEITEGAIKHGQSGEIDNNRNKRHRTKKNKTKNKQHRKFIRCSTQTPTKKERCTQVLAKGIHFLFLSFAVLLISFYYTE